MDSTPDGKTFKLNHYHVGGREGGGPRPAAKRRYVVRAVLDNPRPGPTLPRVLVDFSNYQAVLLDLDGTLYHEDHALPGGVALVRRLQAEGRNFACLTNATQAPSWIVRRLKTMGLEIDPARVYTAVAAACDYVLQRFPAPRLFNLATEGVQELLEGKRSG